MNNQLKTLTQIADNLFEKYSLKATLHIMSGWHIDEQNRVLQKDLAITTPGNDKFQDAEFFVHYNEHFEITSCYPKHKTMDIGAQQIFQPALLTNMV